MSNYFPWLLIFFFRRYFIRGLIFTLPLKKKDFASCLLNELYSLCNIIVSSPTVKNVFIPGVVSPAAPPPRRNRRKHRLRVPCSECHCPLISPTKSRVTSKRPQLLSQPQNRFPPHPLVRSKSAVVRSLYKKMKTPFTRSRTVDENLLRYYSPETSEYSVTPAYMLRPESLGKNFQRRIPEIYVEDCLKVDFNRDFVNRFCTNSMMPFYPRLSRFSGNKILPKLQQNLGNSSRITDWSAGRKTRFGFMPRAKSCEYETISDRLIGAKKFLLQKAKSFEYESLPQSIFSDDSLRTARRKLKRNLSMNDSGYDDTIEILQDQSKPYYEASAENKVYPAQIIPSNNNFYYGYDSELSGAETEINFPSNFDRQSLESVIESVAYNDKSLTNRNIFSTDESRNSLRLTPALDLDCLLHQNSERDEIGKRKYRESDYCEVSFGPSLQRTPEKRPKASDYPDHYGHRRLSKNSSREHIYCSIDDELEPEENREHLERKEERRRSRSKSNDSYLDFEKYDRCDICEKINRWDDPFSFDSPEYEVHSENQFPVVGSEDIDVDISPRDRNENMERYNRFGDENVDHCIPQCHSNDITMTAERARAIYKTRRQSLSVPSLRESKRLTARAESSPQLYSDEDFGSSETIVHLPRRSRESVRRGESTNYGERKSGLSQREREDGGENRGSNSAPDFCYYDEEDFGSRETVVGRPSDYYRRRRNSSCPETREIQFAERIVGTQNSQGSKRNVAISDTLEYYEYSMESESQCSDNCGFGPSNPRRGSHRDNAAHPNPNPNPDPTPPSIANSIVFDSLSANSDTAKNARAANESTSIGNDDASASQHSGKQQQQQQQSTGSSTSRGKSTADLDTDPETASTSRRNRVTSNSTTVENSDCDTDPHRRSSSMPESREYAPSNNPYETSSRHAMSGNGHSGKRGQFTRSLSNADVPPDEKAGE